MQATDPILIVGAGPTGLTAAMELSRFGVPIRIIDKISAFSDTSRALAVQARTLELLEQRGLAREMVELGNKGEAATLYAEGKTLGKVELTLIESRFNYILLLAQSETERILREQLARQGVTIELETELIAFSQSTKDTSPLEGSTRAVLRHADGSLESLNARFLISAEGTHSMLRKTLVLPFNGTSLPHAYALADVHVEGDLPEHELSIFLASTGLMAIFPMGDRRFRLIATEPEQDSHAAEPDMATMQELYNKGSHIPARLYDMMWSSHFKINSRMLDHLRDGLVFFGGDSAHIHSPAGGQGMNTGIQDMINLCWKLALVYDGKAPADLLNTYETERLPVIKGVVSTTETATDAFNSDSSTIHALVTHVASAALHFQFIQHLGAGMLSEVEANYRKSSLSEEHGPLGTLRAGDRIPDLSIQLALTEAQPASLLKELNPNRFTLLVLGKATICCR